MGQPRVFPRGENKKVTPPTHRETAPHAQAKPKPCHLHFHAFFFVCVLVCHDWSRQPRHTPPCAFRRRPAKTTPHVSYKYRMTSLTPAVVDLFLPGVGLRDATEPHRMLFVEVAHYLTPAVVGLFLPRVTYVTSQNHTAGDESAEAWTGHLKHSRFDGGITGTIEKFSRGHGTHGHAHASSPGHGHAKASRGEEKTDGTRVCRTSTHGFHPACLLFTLPMAL